MRLFANPEPDLLEVIERGTRAKLLPMEERQVETCYEGESGLFLDDRAKRNYLGEVEKRIQFEPRVRNILAGRDWCIDCTSLS